MFQLQLDSGISVVELSNSPVVELMSSKEILSMSFSHDSGSLFVMSKSEVASLLCHPRFDMQLVMLHFRL